MKARKFFELAARVVALAFASVVLALAGATPVFASIPPTTSNPIVVTPPDPQTAVEGSSQSHSIGSFSQIGATGPWSVQVNWGDGTSGTFFTTTAQGSLASQSHTFGEEGSYTVTVSVLNIGSVTGPPGIATFQVSAADPAVIAAGVNIFGVAGQPFTAVTATYTDPGGAEPNPFDPFGLISDHYTADCNVNAAKDAAVVRPCTITDPETIFSVSGTFLYPTEGAFTLITDIDHEGVTTEVRSTATIAPAPEPATLTLVGAGLAGLGFSRRRKLN
jgi:hypothetical protein